MKYNQLEQQFTNLPPLVEEISDEKSASLTGGASFVFDIYFDESQTIGPISGVKSGQLFLNTRSEPSNPTFDLILKNLTTGNTFRKKVRVGQEPIIKIGRPGHKDTYQIQLKDEKDGVFVIGKGRLDYTS